MTTSGEELHALIDRLSGADQQRLLTYAQALTHKLPLPHTPLPPGSAPGAFLNISVGPEVGEAMQRALDDCEQIVSDDWE